MIISQLVRRKDIGSGILGLRLPRSATHVLKHSLRYTEKIKMMNRKMLKHLS